MDDFEAQEIEFWRKLEEEGMSRGGILKRSAAAAAGLTVLASPASALAALRRADKNPPLKGRGFSLREMAAEAKKEGRLNTIALPPDWANYGEILSTFQKKYNIPITNDNPDGS
jgi:putative spermidine/putrescine transport system substrate-binding protein